jgi:polyhydroxyalkanoate synthesis regulator phasin
MPQPNSSSSAGSAPHAKASSTAKTPAKSKAASTTTKRTTRAPKSIPAPSAPAAAAGESRTSGGVTDGLTGFAEQLVNRIFKPLDRVVLSRERIQDVLDDAAERGRMTRTDANELVSELVRKGRQQTDDVVAEIDKLVGRGRDQIESATRKARQSEPVDRLVRTADRARRTVGVGPTFPIAGYDDLTAGQVTDRLPGLQPAELRKVRDYERRHANRKSVLDGIEKELG